MSDVTVWMLNEDLGLQRSGVENSALLRSRLFSAQLGIRPVFLTGRFNPRIHQNASLLMQSADCDGLPVFRSIYNFLQDSEDFVGASNTGEAIIGSPHFRSTLVDRSRDVRVLDSAGRLLMYVVRDVANDELIHVNHFAFGVKFRRDVYDSRGFLSCIQYLHEKSRRVVLEQYLRPDGSLAIAKFYSIVNNRSIPTDIRLCGRSGGVEMAFHSESELLAYAMERMLIGLGGGHVLLVDKNRLFYETAIQVRDRVAGVRRVVVVPVIHALHVKSYFDIEKSPTNSNYKSILDDPRRPDAILTLTSIQKNDLHRRYGSCRVFDIGHSYESRRPPSSFAQRDRFRIVSMARYSPEKNHALALKALVEVFRKYPRANVDFYGYGPCLPDLRLQVEALGLNERIRLNGWTENAAEQYEKAGLSLLTSQAESFSLSIMESLCHGCPAIAFDVPYGPAQLIEHDRTGFLVPFGDVLGLSAAIMKLFDDASLHASMSECARIQSAKFSSSNVAKQWRAMFEDLGIS